MTPEDLPVRWESMLSTVGRCQKRLSDRLKKKIKRLNLRILMLNSRKWSAS